MSRLGRVLTRGAKRRRTGILFALGLAVALLAALGGVLIEHATANAPTISGDSNAAVAPTDVSTPSPSSTSVTATTGSTQKMVALTFDDGPGPDTQKVATVLEEEKAAGTFFFIGRQIAKYPGIVSGLRAQGFELEDHTWDHANLTKLSAAQVRLEISRTSTFWEEPSICGLLRGTTMPPSLPRSTLWGSSSYSGTWTPWIGNTAMRLPSWPMSAPR